MSLYNKVNTALGWVVASFAMIVYGLTMEDSVSFWDCGEFIAAAYKLEVVHPPGAPLFLMIGRVFTFFAGENLEMIPVMINFMSGLTSALAILFVFWSVTIIARLIIAKDGEMNPTRMIAIMGTGVIAALCGTFADSFWFSAVEGEVYALSICFMTFVIWAALRWFITEGPNADRWLLLIAYALGLSIGVHLLSLQAIPAIAVLYYFKKFKNKGSLLKLGLFTGGSFVLVLVFLKVIIPLVPSLSAKVDLTFVNSFGLPFNSGFWFVSLLLVVGLMAGIAITHKRGAVELNKLLLAFSFVMIGMMSYLFIPIRSSANTPINMNKPQDPFSILYYINREQYGERPLLRGPQYIADGSFDITAVNKGKQNYYKGKDAYIPAGEKETYEWRDDVQSGFPRLGFWQEQRHANAYRGWLSPSFNIIDRGKNNEVVATFDAGQLQQARQFVKDRNEQAGAPRYAVRDDISGGMNLRFFFQYQLGFMYGRYLMWNFAGRQDDIQGFFHNNNGRWESGLGGLDDLFIVPFSRHSSSVAQSELPPHMQGNWANNHFYMIPFILGLIGMVFLFRRDKETFFAIFLLFMATGAIQIIYLNQPPVEPRERDYIFAGNFLTFAMYIGFGMLAFFELLKRFMSEKSVVTAIIPFAVCMVAPILMGTQGWDDHDRSNRYTARDFAVNYLESCDENAIIFTQGDNDTYPLWYAQEVENIRPDLRVVNLSLLGVDWYIDQLRYKMNDADAIKLTFSQDQVEATNRDITRYGASNQFAGGQHHELTDVMAFIAREDAGAKTAYSNGDLANYLPTKKFKISIDSAHVVNTGAVHPNDYGRIADEMKWSIGRNNLIKNDLITYDIIANNIHDRPIYFAVSVSPDAYLGMQKYFQLEGLAYRIVPIENQKVNNSYNAQYSRVRTDFMFENMMNEFQWGNMADEGVYLDENILRMTMNMRANFGRLAQALVSQSRSEGDDSKKEMAVQALDRCFEVMPMERIPVNIFCAQMPDVYYQCDENEKARVLLEALFENAYQEMAYMKRMNPNLDLNGTVAQQNIYILQQMDQLAQRNEDPEYAATIRERLTSMGTILGAQLTQ